MQKSTNQSSVKETIPATRYVYDPSRALFSERKATPKFIKGPIPFDWMQTANALPGKAGQVGIALWFLAGVKKSKTVKITSEAERLAGCVRQTFAKGLAALEVAGLVAVERKPGQKATVEII
ncbi:MAG: hypothetical protein U0997_07150 [Sulfurimicrobium sp.]|nr:hypothetical protein [Sulfurimicrobium sp.]